MISYLQFAVTDRCDLCSRKALRRYKLGQNDALFEFLYYFPGWPKAIHGRANLMAAYSGYGENIVLHRGDGLVVHPSKDGRVVTIEYEVRGKIVKTGAAYDNRLIAVVTIENRKIVRWRDYMDSLAAWVALNNGT